MTESRTYIAIDLKTFYASVECMERGLDPLTTNLVVADTSRTEKTICLAVSPSLKAYGIPGRARLFEVVQKVREVNAIRRRQAPDHVFSGSSADDRELKADAALSLDYIAAPPRMNLYMDYSTKIYNIYLNYIAPEDIHVYSIDEVFIDVTSYLGTYRLTARELARKMILDVLKATGITATAGVGTNLYLCKIAMDIVAKRIEPDENGVRIAELDELSYPLRISGVWERDMRKSWRNTAFIPWAILQDVPWADRGIIIMRICCTSCLGSMQSFSLTMHGDGNRAPLRTSRHINPRRAAWVPARCCCARTDLKRPG